MVFFIYFKGKKSTEEDKHCSIKTDFILGKHLVLVVYFFSLPLEEVKVGKFSHRKIIKMRYLYNP